MDMGEVHWDTSKKSTIDDSIDNKSESTSEQSNASASFGFETGENSNASQNSTIDGKVGLDVQGDQADLREIPPYNGGASNNTKNLYGISKAAGSDSVYKGKTDEGLAGKSHLGPEMPTDRLNASTHTNDLVYSSHSSVTPSGSLEAASSPLYAQSSACGPCYKCSGH